MKKQSGSRSGKLFPEQAHCDPNPENVIPPGQTAYGAANDIIRARLALARQNEAGIIADQDSEFLHEYRVALRKIRSAISLFGGVYEQEQTAALKRRLADLMAPTGRLRDLDVYLLECGKYHDLLPETLHEGLTMMIDAFRQERWQEHQKIARLLQSPEYAAAIAGLEEIFAADSGPARGPKASRPMHDYARRLIQGRYRKVCKLMSRIDERSADAELHELRINCKKLHYLMEFFAHLLPRAPFKALIAPLKELQGKLGLFNDCSVQQESLRVFLDCRPPKECRDERAMTMTIGALIAILHQRQTQERARIVASFAHFDTAAFRRNFARLSRNSDPRF